MRQHFGGEDRHTVYRAAVRYQFERNGATEEYIEYFGPHPTPNPANGNATRFINDSTRYKNKFVMLERWVEYTNDWKRK